ncbi:MAG: hypothetical protein RL386_528, partial [Bacteroidota bacterium]
MKSWIITSVVVVLSFLIPASVRWDVLPVPLVTAELTEAAVPRDSMAFWVVVPRDIPVRRYFKWMDSLVQVY